MARLISDDVWRRLDPNAGRLSGATRRRMWRAMGAAALLGAASTLLVWAGAAVPRMAVVRDSMAWGGGPEVAPYFEIGVANTGWMPVTVLGVGTGGPGMELTEVRGHFPSRLSPGDGVQVMFVFRVTDCAAVASRPWSLTVIVERWWGRQSADVDLPSHWVSQRDLADLVCNPTP